MSSSPSSTERSASLVLNDHLGKTYGQRPVLVRSDSVLQPAVIF